MTLLPEIESDSSDIIGKMFSLDAECIKVSGIVEATLIVVSILLKQDYYSKTSLIPKIQQVDNYIFYDPGQFSSTLLLNSLSDDLFVHSA